MEHAATLPTAGILRSSKSHPAISSSMNRADDHGREESALRALLAETVTKLEAAPDEIIRLRAERSSYGDVTLSPSDHERALAYLSGRWNGNIFESDAER